MSRQRRSLLFSASAAALALTGLAPGAQAAKPVDFRAFVSGANQAFFSLAEVNLWGTCANPVGQPVLQPRVEIESDTEDLVVHASSQSEVAGGDHHAFRGYDDLDPLDLSQPLIDHPVDEPGTLAGDEGVGQIVYATPSKTVVAIDWLAEGIEDDQAQIQPLGVHCAFMGTARQARKGSGSHVFHARAEGTPKKKVFDRGGLELRARCATDDGQADLDLWARSEVNGATLAAVTQSDVLTDGNDEFDFDGTDVMAKGNPGQVRLDDFDGIVDEDAVGRLVWAGKKTVVSVDFLAEGEGEALGKDCVFAGVARVAQKGSPRRVLYRRDAPGPFKTIFEGGALRVANGCPVGVGNNLNQARTGPDDAPDAISHFASTSDLGDDTIDEQAYNEDDTMDASNSAFTGASIANSDALGRTVAARESGEITSFDWLADEGGAFGRDCVLAGTTEIADTG